MRERPILFSSPMVRALLDGSKTQTRRVVKGTNGRIGPLGGLGFPDKTLRGITQFKGGQPLFDMCPYGDGGDRLWVRETWQFADWTVEGQPFVRFAADSAVQLYENAGEGETLVNTWAELSAPGNYDIDGKAADRRWRPSIFMPRWASRIALTITDVRVERLQDISEADAKAEGATARDADFGQQGWNMDWSRVGQLSRFAGGVHSRSNKQPLTVRDLMLRTPANAFASYWESINGKESWSSNPWAWVVSFDVERSK